MKKKQQLKLGVDRETLRQLTPRELSIYDLQKVAGGLTAQCTYFCTSHCTSCM